MKALDDLVESSGVHYLGACSLQACQLAELGPFR
jgi:hypothetical protein